MTAPRSTAANRYGFPLLLALLLLTLKWPTVSLPVWGDGQAYVVPNGLLLLNEPARLFIPDEVHPPFYFRLLAESYRVFGTSLLVTHGLVLVFAFLALLYTWRLGEGLFGRGSGAAASLMLLFSPLFFCQAGLVRLSIPLTALAVMTLYYGMSGRPLPLALCGAALVLTQHPGIFIVAGLLAGLLLQATIQRFGGVAPEEQRIRRRLILAAALPVGVFILWALLCRLHYGWMFHPENTADLGLEAGPMLARVGYWLRQMLLLKSMWVPALFIVIGGAVALPTRVRKNGCAPADQGGWKLAMALGLPFVFFIGFFSCYAFDFPRYLLPLYPACFLLAAAGARNLHRRPTAGLVLLLALSLPLFACGWFREYTVPRPREYYESDLAYLQVLQAKKTAAAYIEQQHPGETVLTGKPALDLREPAFGYVSQPMTVIHLPRRRGLDLERFRQADLFYLFSATSPPISGENKAQLIRAGIHPVLEADFSIPAIPLKLYRLEPLATARGGSTTTTPEDGQ
jgi:hypothetical protein